MLTSKGSTVFNVKYNIDLQDESNLIFRYILLKRTNFVDCCLIPILSFCSTSLLTCFPQVSSLIVTYLSISWVECKSSVRTSCSKSCLLSSRKLTSIASCWLMILIWFSNFFSGKIGWHRLINYTNYNSESLFRFHWI